MFAFGRERNVVRADRKWSVQVELKQMAAERIRARIRAGIESIEYAGNWKNVFDRGTLAAIHKQSHSLSPTAQTQPVVIRVVGRFNDFSGRTSAFGRAAPWALDAVGAAACGSFS